MNKSIKQQMKHLKKRYGCSLGEDGGLCDGDSKSNCCPKALGKIEGRVCEIVHNTTGGSAE